MKIGPVLPKLSYK